MKNKSRFFLIGLHSYARLNCLARWAGRNCLDLQLPQGQVLTDLAGLPLVELASINVVWLGVSVLYRFTRLTGIVVFRSISGSK